MKNVARAASVSLGSSHYLNNRVSVLPSKAARIQRAIGEFGYRVDQGARSLRRGQTQTVGLIVPDISNPFYAELARVLEHCLWDESHQTLLCNSAHDAARERTHFTNLLDRRVDGIFVIYAGEASAWPRAAATAPVVFLDRPVAGQLSVASGNFLGSTLAAQHLLELGHKRIGALVGDGVVANLRARMDGFTAALAAAEVTLNPEYVRRGTQNLALGERATELMRLPNPPTAIVATNDIVAIGAWRTLLARGLRIQQDVSLIGFDNIELGRLLLPPLTTVAQNFSTLGARAAELFFHPPKGTAPAVRGVVIAPQLLVRGSAARPERSTM